MKKAAAIVRVFRRALAFLLFIFAAIALRAIVLVCSKESRALRARAGWIQGVARRCCEILHLRVQRSGSLPQSGLLVANHLSYIDIILLAAQQPCVFVSKLDVKEWPLFGACAQLGGTIFVDRNHRADVAGVAQQIRAALDGNVLVVLFPEGTSSGGSSVLPFKSSLLEPPIRLGCPVTAAAIGYALDEGSVPNEICYWRDMTLLPHLLNVWSKPVIHATLRCGVPRSRRGDRKSLALELRNEVAALHAVLLREFGLRLPQAIEEPVPVLARR
jgi:1-acyl-sn-glycerol-3-phosphate acyltransferase